MISLLSSCNCHSARENNCIVVTRFSYIGTEIAYQVVFASEK